MPNQINQLDQAKTESNQEETKEGKEIVKSQEEVPRKGFRSKVKNTFRQVFKGKGNTQKITAELEKDEIIQKLQAML